MNEQQDVICQACGAQLSVEQKFCHVCGSEVVKPVAEETRPAFCPTCGKELNEGQNFCPNCGVAVNAQAQAVQASVAPKVRHSGTNQKSFILDLIRRSLVLAMAIFLLVAAFLPMIKLKMDLGDEKVNVNFNAIDGIAFAVNSFASEDEKETTKAMEDLYEDMDVEEYEEDWENGDELDRFSSCLKKVFHIMLRSEEISTSSLLIGIMILSIVQIVLVILLFVFAVLSFVAVFVKKMKGTGRLPLLLMGLVAVVMLANAFAFTLSFGGSISVLDVVSVSAAMGAIPICVAVLTVALMLIFFVLRLVDGDRIRVGTVVKHALSLIFAVILLVSAFAPVVKTEVKTAFDSDESNPQRATAFLDASLFDYLDWSKSQKEEFDDLSTKEMKAQANEMAKMTFFWLQMYTKREFQKGEADAVNGALFSTLLLGYGAYEFSTLFTLGSLAMLLVFLCALLLIWKNVYELATGRRISAAMSIPVKILAILMAIIVLALVIVMSLIVTNNAENIPYTAFEVKNIYKAAVAYGPILMLVSAIGMACVPSAISKRSKKAAPVAVEVEQ